MIDAYSAHLASYREAALTSDSMSEALSATTTGELLTTIRRTLVLRSDDGVASRPASPSIAKVEVVDVSIDGVEAHLRLCAVDDAVVFRVSDGSILDDDVSTSRTAVHVVEEDGVWKVAAAERIGEKYVGEEMVRCLAES